MSQQLKRKQAGSAMLMSLFVLGWAVTLTAVGLNRAMSEKVAAQYAINKQQAFEFADAGLDVAWRELRQTAGTAFQGVDPFGNPLWAHIPEDEEGGDWQHAQCNSGWQEASETGRWPCQARTVAIADNGMVDIVVKGAQSATPYVTLRGRIIGNAGMSSSLTTDGVVIDARFAVTQTVARPFLYATYNVATAMWVGARVKIDSYDSSLGDYGAFIGGSGWQWNRSDDTKDNITGLPIGDSSTWNAIIRSNSNSVAKPANSPPVWSASAYVGSNFPYLPVDAWGVPDIWGQAVVGVPVGYAAPAMDNNEITSYIGSFPYSSPPAGYEGRDRIHDPDGFSSAAAISTPAIVFPPTPPTISTATLNSCAIPVMSIDTFNTNYSQMNLPQGCSLTLTGDGTLHLIRDNYVGAMGATSPSTLTFTGSNVAVLVEALPAVGCPACQPSGGFSFLKKSNLVLGSSTTVKYYLTPGSGFASTRDTQINATGKPPQLTIYGKNNPAQPHLIGIAAGSEKPFTSEFRGNIYAPDMDIQVGTYVDTSLTGLVKYFGSIVGRKVSIGFFNMNKDNHIEMHFDTAPTSIDSGLASPFGAPVTTVQLRMWQYRGQ